MILRSVIKGAAAMLLLLGIYFAIVTLISGWAFAKNQFFTFWYFMIGLALGFGIQIGLYTYLKNATRQQDGSGKALAVSGTTSTVAMISCCAHYLTNILPIIAVTGAVTLISQYQIELFWIGLAFNAAGIVYIGNKVLGAKSKFKA